MKNDIDIQYSKLIRFTADWFYFFMSISVNVFENFVGINFHGKAQKKAKPQQKFLLAKVSDLKAPR